MTGGAGVPTPAAKPKRALWSRIKDRGAAVFGGLVVAVLILWAPLNAVLNAVLADKPAAVPAKMPAASTVDPSVARTDVDYMDGWLTAEGLGNYPGESPRVTCTRFADFEVSVYRGPLVINYPHQVAGCIDYKVEVQGYAGPDATNH